MNRIARCIFAFLFLVCSLHLRAQLIQIHVVEEDLSALGLVEDIGTGGVAQDFTGFTKYRVYAELASQENKVTALYGIPTFDADTSDPECVFRNNPLLIQSTGQFFQHPLTGPFGSDQFDPTETASSLFPTALHDSFLTLGVEHQNSAGAESLVAVSQIPSETTFEDWDSGQPNNLTAFDAVLATYLGGQAGFPDENGQVLLGQFVTDGDFSFQINLSLLYDPESPTPEGEAYWAVNNDESECGNDIVEGECGCALGLIYPEPDSCLPFSLDCTSCDDLLACNYNPDAVNPDNSTCLYEVVISGHVFNDLDQNQDYSNNNFDEYGLANIQVEIEELGWSSYTNNDGHFEFINVPSGSSYTLSVVGLDESWEGTTPLTINITTPSCSSTANNFGLVGVGTNPVFLSGPCCIFMMDIHCDLGFNPGLWVNNTGSSPLNGTITVAFDNVLEAEAYGYPSQDPTNIEPGLVTWDISDHLGGQNLLYQSHIIGPGFEYMGQTFPIEITLNLTDDDGVTYYENTWILEPIVVCSYDPNDKYAANEGYTEEHFILPNETIEYRVRFQNTGNFQAFKVRVDDQLDLEHLDVETFTPIVSSHSMMTCINDEGFIEFHFDNINLPDSASDEPGSQGYLVYQIRLKEDVEPGDVINNTAEIFFDSNPAVVTNTTWHTIYGCPAEPEVAETDVYICAGDEFTLEATEPYMEAHTWLLDDAEIGTEAQLDYTLSEPGLYEFEVTMTNPLCSTFRLLSVEVYALPEADFTLTENGMEASASTTYQWVLNGEPIDGATEQSYSPLVDGNYAVIVTNENNCTSTSDTQFVTNIHELGQMEYTIFPNPSSDFIKITTANAEPFDVRIINAQGKVVLRKIQHENNHPIDLSLLAAGAYQVAINDGVIKTLIIE